MRDWLLQLRKQKNMTQAQVANKADIARTTYSMIEIGKRNATVENAKKIANVLGFKWTIFFEDHCHETRKKDKEKEAI